MGFFRVQLSGATPYPAETWSVGMSFVGPNTVMPFDDLQAWATGIGTAITALVSNPIINILSSAGNINRVRTEQRSETDESLMQAAEYGMPSPESGAGTVSKALQTSAVISILTGQPGRSYRGRVYWPAWAYTPSATGLFTSGDQTAWLTGFKAILDLINAQAIAVDAAYQMLPGVRSRLLHETNDAFSLAIGSVPDTQRRRRDAAVETYVTLVL